MSIKKFFRKFLYGGTSYLFAYEAKAIVAFYQSLEASDKDRLQKQLTRLDLVQRYPDGKTITFFDLDDLENDSWPESVLFDNRGENETLANVQVSLLSNISLSAKFNFQNGSIFGIKFNKKLNKNELHTDDKNKVFLKKLKFDNY